MQNNTKIKIKSLYKSFGNRVVLNGIDLEIRQGKSLVILGSSGTGKSVLIKTIIGLIKPDRGSISIDGVEVVNVKNRDRFDIMKKCGFLFQGGALFDSLNVQDNITFFVRTDQKLSTSECKDLATEKLESVGLEPTILKSFPAELSGGMQKRVALARAICGNPEIIFFDEPTTGLDPIMTNIINELIIDIGKKLKSVTMITITHDINSASKIADDIAFIHDGKIIWHGQNSEMRNSSDPYLHQFINGSVDGPISY